MTENGTPTKRVELRDGGWAEVRLSLTVDDIRAQREAAHVRGYEDATLDAFALLPRIIVAWSGGDVTDAAVGALGVADAGAIMAAFNEPIGPNASSPSRAGAASPKASRRGSGG